ncbi:MAG: ABC transporter ATP-binding protein [Firmicutes bacterium]|nr:ABC transporter ATP-binding protein [Bacillota bacterium]
MAKMRKKDMMPPQKAKDFAGTMKTLLSYLKPYRIKLFIVFLFSILSTLFSIISPAVLGAATDKVVDGLKSVTGIDFSGLLYILMALLAMYLLSLAFGVIQSWIMADVSQKVIYTLRDKMSAKLDRLPLKYFDTKTHGEFQSRMVNDIETVNQTLSNSLTATISSITTVLGTLIMMLKISWLMTLVALISMPLSMIVIKFFVSKSQGHFKNQQKYLGLVNGHVEEMYSGHDIVKAFNREEESEKVFTEYNDKLYEAAWKSQFISGIMRPMTIMIGNLAYVAVCIMGGYLAINGRVSIGDIQAFIQYVRNFNHPVSQLASIVNQLQSTAAAAERIFELIDEEEEVDLDKAPAAHIDADNAKGHVSFEHVSFGYKKDEPVIKDFSFDAKPGQRVAIVGHTGAGKTTIVKLLMRFYELDGGRILIDDTDITDLSRENLRELFGMVLQDTWLYNDTIRENIRYGNREATDEEIEAAAYAAHIHHFIKTQPKGYDMEINEEASNISAGQKQLLTIARAFLADAPILILDEATSSVDTRTESLIQKAMANLMHGRTSFIIAHRLSTIKDADHILVMDHGDIIEQGSHEELLARGGVYEKLYNSQFAK